MPDFDELRRTFPDVGFAIYAYDPTGDVALEIHERGNIHIVEAPTLAECIARIVPVSEPETKSLDPFFDM